MKQKDFKELCIRLGLVDGNLKIDYSRVLLLMELGQIHMLKDLEKEKYPALYNKMWSDYEIMKEYDERR